MADRTLSDAEPPRASAYMAFYSLHRGKARLDTDAYNINSTRCSRAIAAGACMRTWRRRPQGMTGSCEHGDPGVEVPVQGCTFWLRMWQLSSGCCLMLCCCGRECVGMAVMSPGQTPSCPVGGAEFSFNGTRLTPSSWLALSALAQSPAGGPCKCACTRAPLWTPCDLFEGGFLGRRTGKDPSARRGSEASRGSSKDMTTSGSVEKHIFAMCASNVTACTQHACASPDLPANGSTLLCRRSISEIKQQFPGVDFSLIESDEDVLWKEDEREQLNAMRVSPRRCSPARACSIACHFGACTGLVRSSADASQTLLQ